MACNRARIGDVASFRKQPIEPEPGVTYYVYSLPAFDNGHAPEVFDGSEVLSSKLHIEDGDILVNKLNMRFKRIWPICQAVENSVCSTEFVPLVPNDHIDPRYLYYVLLSDQFTHELSSMRTGTSGSHQRVKPEWILNYEFELPDKLAQRKIGSFLGALDSKIVLNQHINDYLEQLLLSRFDRLFLPTDSFNGTIADIGDVVGGATPSKKRPDYYCRHGIGWITPRDLSNITDKFIAHGADDITQAGFDSCSVKKLPAGTVLFSSRAPIGYIAIATDEVTTNQGFKSIVPRREVGTAFVYCFLTRNKNRIADAGSGTTFPEISGKTMSGIELALPDTALCAEFEEWATPILNEQCQLEAENRALCHLRDALLPKLMSGEIDASKIDLTQPNNHLCVD